MLIRRGDTRGTKLIVVRFRLGESTACRFGTLVVR
jgi:hypothetical protein